MKYSGVEWIGDIPDDWEIKTVKQLLCERTEKNTDLKTTTILSLSAKDGITLYSEHTHTGNRPREDLSDYKVVYPLDIVVNSMNILSGAVGLSAYTGCISGVYYVYYPRFNDNIEFLHYIFQCKQFQLSLRGLGNGILIKESESGNLNTIRMRIPAQKLAAQLLPYCDISTQQKIAEYLDYKCGQVDGLIANQQAQIEKLKQYKQSVITEAVTRCLNPYSPLKDSGIDWIGSIPENWVTCPLKTLFTFDKGLPITKADLLPIGIKVISYGQIHAKYNKAATINPDLFRFVSDGYLDNNINSLVQEGDFIFADTSEDVEGSGDFVYIDKEYDYIFAGYHCVVLKHIKSDNNKYLAYLFMSNVWKSQIQSRVCGVKLFSISRGLISKSSVILPPLEEQQQIADYLDNKCGEIDRLISLKQQKIDALTSYKKSLIYEYVTGKKEVV